MFDYRMISILLLLCLSVKADPTKPAGIVSPQAQAVQQEVSKPKLEAVMTKNGVRMAVINGQWVTEAHQSEHLRVLGIDGNQVEVEYMLNGEWKRDTLVVARHSFVKKSSVQIE